MIGSGDLATLARGPFPVVVVFRRWPERDGGDVLALFPLEREHDGQCLSYQHVGQHSSADYQACMARTDPARVGDDDVKALRRELESIGYVLTVRQRRPRR